jgi:LysR family transcriptional regulator, glycine cleavage system transcriptional activator
LAHFRKNLPSMSALLALEAAARHRSITLAAAELGVTQAAVSRQISALEADLGQPLFVRRHRAIEPTQACLALTAQLASSFTAIGRSVEATRAHPREREVTIGTTLAFSTLWLMPRLRALRDAVPMAQVRMVARDSRIGLDGGEADVVVRFGIPPFDDARVVASRRDVLVPVCSPGFAARIEDPDRFIADPTDLIENEVSDRQWYAWSDWFARAGLSTRAAPALRFNHYTDAIEAARAGQGVALGWHTLCARYLTDGSLVRLGSRAVNPDGLYNVLLPARREPDPVAVLAAEWLAEQLTC